MSDVLSFYEQQASARFSTVPWLAQTQEQALVDFTRLGFPIRDQEDWKYTSTDAFLQQRFMCDENIATYPSVPSALKGMTIALVNGIAVGIESITPHLPTGVIIQPLAEALVKHADKIKPYLNRILQQQHGFHALNTAMLHNGIFIYIPASVRLTTPIILSHWQDKTDQATYLRHLIVAEAGSSVSVVEDYHGKEDTGYFTNTITEAALAANARLTHYKIQRDSKFAYHVGHLAVTQAANSQLHSHAFSMGGKLVRSDITISLKESGAHCSMNGIYAPSDLQHIDHHTQVSHEVPNCSSEQDYKGILSGQSRAVFNGQVSVAKGAQHTSAKQQNKNLLLSKQAEINTKPQLDIFADDVICTHGATVGHLDEEALFYLATRGIGGAEAHRYLVRAFATENLKKLDNPDLEEWLGALLNQQLG